MATVGLLLVAIGVALGIVSNIGVGALSVPSYVLGGVCGLSVGNWVIIVNMAYILIQAFMLGNNFRLVYLMQVPANFIFGYFIDWSLLALSWLHPESFVARVVVIIIACLVSAIGVSIEVYAKGWMLSAETTVYAIIQRIPAQFGTVKIFMDSSIVLTGCIISLFVNGNLLGRGEFEGLIPQILGTADGIVVGLGTIFMAFFPGWLMRFTDPVIKHLFGKMSVYADYHYTE